jgi:hypothetical protein
VAIDKNKIIKGLINTLTAKKTYLLGAEFTVFDHEYFKHVFKMKRSDKLDFPSLFELHSAKSIDPD